jgi:putative sigma-54 modulation protein
MQVNITARHLELTQALADYVRKKVERCERYSDNLTWAQVILTVEKYRQVAEVIIHGASKTFRSQEESIDLYAAIDVAVDKIEKQLKKYKEIAKVHRKTSKTARKAAGTPAPEIVTFGEPGKGLHVITEVKRFDVKPTTIQEAINEMELMGYKFYMFLNSDTTQINVVYQRDNGSYGLLEPEM